MKPREWSKRPRGPLSSPNHRPAKAESFDDIGSGSGQPVDVSDHAAEALPTFFLLVVQLAPVVEWPMEHCGQKQTVSQRASRDWLYGRFTASITDPSVPR